MESLTPPLLTLGVTGGIGSGKSAVCRFLAEAGARVFSADRVAKQIMTDDPSARQDIRAAFGAESYHEDGSLNRAFLAGQVFSSEEKVKQINRIVHPRVFAAFQNEKRRVAAEGGSLLVHEAALIFESGGDRHLDAVLVVDAPLETRIRRVMDRDGVTEAQVRARMDHQLPAAELRRRADYVIDNDGTLDALKQRVDAFYTSFLDRSG